ncbi:monosaccharide ABC transporter ATP-binding protein (CUT2 family) [Aliiruegeria haliotis]|uniref:Monosaccharide ABC transporter ATP-binding protein (CUT2 family) n=1 Tax=Aliiruegeria haliotis TaxID=1280846 RepID=A0A2T0RW30_9RHOB|nr:sugar ABC transporter ATP-binding protein [Aliiruegeria haliotis]PRY25358.1 monosaccharide ABC transporter ATP-binding protein (CUT2 family) [Aliiruegeria haliotis]
MSSAILDVQGVGKSFPGVKALSDVNMKVHPGEVVAFVGENGAGKSTLLKILCGDYTLDEGTVYLDGAEVSHASPLEARDAGFRLVRQEPEIVPHISAAENIFIGEYPRLPGGRVDHAEMRRITTDLLERYGFAGVLDIDALGRTLSPAQQHIVEILRALKEGVKVVAFDEPTSSLTTKEADRLFALIRKLREEGLGIIYVSHRLHEVMAISDRVVVLKDGVPTGNLMIKDTDEEEIVRLMVGRELAHGYKRDEVTTDEVVLEVENLRSRWHDGISFQIRAGEIVGFAGLVGAGRTELAKVLFGEFEKEGGTVKICGDVKDIRSPADAIAANIGFAPENRKAEGLILVRSVIENASMAVYSALARFGILRTQQMVDKVSPFVRQLEIKTPSMEQEVGKLSGGNQQKVVLARWLAAAPRLLILDEPTRAVDVGAKAEIYRLIDDLAKQGMAIMMISSEMPELLSMSDRIIVMRDGVISDPIEKKDATEEAIVNFALGTKAA